MQILFSKSIVAIKIYVFFISYLLSVPANAQPFLPAGCLQLARIADTCYQEFDEELKNIDPDKAILQKTLLSEIVVQMNTVLPANHHIKNDIPTMKAFYKEIYKTFLISAKENNYQIDVKQAMAELCADTQFDLIEGLNLVHSSMREIIGNPSPKCDKVMNQIKLSRER